MFFIATKQEIITKKKCIDKLALHASNAPHIKTNYSYLSNLNDLITTTKIRKCHDLLRTMLNTQQQ